MKTKNLLLIFLFALSGLYVTHAQSPDIFLGAKAGLGIPNLSAGSKTTPLSEGYSSRLGFYGGIVGEFHPGGRFSLRMEINYSSQGGKRKGMQALPLISELEPLWQTLPEIGITPDPYMYVNIKSEAKLDYLEIPIMAKYTISLGSKLNLYMQAGPYFGFLLHAENTTSGSSKIYVDKAGNMSVDDILQQAAMNPIGPQSFDHTENITSDIKKFNIGIQGSAGFELVLGKDKLFIEGGGNYGFIPIQKDDADGTNQTGAGTVTVGYLYGLK